MPTSKTIVVLVVIVVALSPKHYPQCEQEVFRRANPGLCTVTPGQPSFPVGGGGNPGILGRILDGLGLGGLL